MSYLVISVDDLAAFAVLKSLYPGTVHTPNIDRLMAMGTTFENGFSQVALCNPSRTSTLTGLSPAHTGVHQNDIEYWTAVQPDQLLMSYFQDAGFHTSMIGKVMHSMRVPEEYSARFADFVFEDRTGVGSEYYGVMDPATRASNGDEVNIAQALDLLASYNPNDPFAMFVGINKPHLNWVVPQEFYDLYPIDQIVEWPSYADDLADLGANALLMTGERRWDLDADEVGPAAIQAYLAAISYADHLVGMLLDQLEESGLSDSTTIVLWTDHGYHLGDKDKWGKFTLWDTAARAPFIIAQPGESDDGQVVTQVVELLDIMPTLLDLSGLGVPEGLDGRSLVDFIADPTLMDDGAALTSMQGNVSLRTNDWRLIRYTDGELELYSADDVDNVVNLINDPAYAQVVEDMLARLYAEAVADGWVLGQGEGVLVGTDANETFVPMSEDDIYGGNGNDTYNLMYVLNQHQWSTVHEEPDGGYDTVRSDIRILVIPANVERAIAFNPAAIVYGTDDGETIIGGQTIYAGGGNDVISSGDGDDYIVAGRGNDFIHGGFGFDTLDYSGSATSIYVRWRIVTSQDYGRDEYTLVERVIGTSFADTIYGTNQPDTFEGLGASDWINGEEGNDTIDGGDGSDHLLGGRGDDVVIGGTGWDVVEGGDGNDRLEGNNGDDALLGDNGNDDLSGGHGWDWLRGGDGADVLRGDNGNDLLSGDWGDDLLLGGVGDDTLDGGFGWDSLRGGDGADVLRGDNGNDLLSGDSGDDRLLGGNGDDTLDAGFGWDAIEGGDGADILIGNHGRDLLTGGAGFDRFVFRSERDSMVAAPDVILDLEVGDRIDLSAIDAIWSTVENDAFRFIGAEAFSGAAGELRYSNGLLSGDLDGDGIADFAITISGSVALETIEQALVL